MVKYKDKIYYCLIKRRLANNGNNRILQIISLASDSLCEVKYDLLAEISKTKVDKFISGKLNQRFYEMSYIKWRRISLSYDEMIFFKKIGRIYLREQYVGEHHNSEEPDILKINLL